MSSDLSGNQVENVNLGRRTFVLGGLAFITAMYAGIEKGAFAAGESPAYKSQLVSFLKSMKTKYTSDVKGALDNVEKYKFRPGETYYQRTVSFSPSEWASYGHLTSAGVVGIAICIKKGGDGTITASAEVLHRGEREPRSHDIPLK